MIVMLTARRLKPDSFDQFVRTFAQATPPPGLKHSHHARNIRDEDEVVSFGLFDLSLDEYRRWREEADAEENARVDALSVFVEHEYVSGVYEVADTDQSS